MYQYLPKDWSDSGVNIVTQIEFTPTNVNTSLMTWFRVEDSVRLFIAALSRI